MGSEEDFANYHFIEDKAYTEDDLLVYNISVYNVPGKTTTAEFVEYFEKFGEIVSVQLLDVCNENVDNQNSKIGFANFKDPESAAKVLKKADHTIKRNPVYVKVCHSRQQPDHTINRNPIYKACHSRQQPDAQPAADTAAPDFEMDTSVSSLLNLNDDCLFVIFKYMKLVDQINLASCCCRLSDVFIMRTKIEYKMLDLKDLECLTLWQIRNFLQFAGPHIQTLRGVSPLHHFESVIEFIGIYCVNVKSISMSGQYLSANSLRKLLRNTHLVEVLNLDDVELKDESIPVLKKLNNFKQLSLTENYQLNGHEIKCRTTVSHLSINMCCTIEPTFFKQICENLTGLQFLDIEDCTSLTASSMTEIVKHLNKLETIKLSCDIDEIASLPRLKNLHFGVFHTVSAQFFKELAKFKADQLEILEIPYYSAINLENFNSIGELTNLKELICPNNHKLNDNCLQKLSKLHELEVLDIHDCHGFTAKGLLDLIQKCRKLITLNVSYCEHLDDEFVTKLLELLNSQRKQCNRNKTLELFGYCSGIGRSAVKAAEEVEEPDRLFSMPR